MHCLPSAIKKWPKGLLDGDNLTLAWDAQQGCERAVKKAGMDYGCVSSASNWRKIALILASSICGSCCQADNRTCICTHYLDLEDGIQLWNNIEPPSLIQWPVCKPHVWGERRQSCFLRIPSNYFQVAVCYIPSLLKCLMIRFLQQREDGNHFVVAQQHCAIEAWLN